MNTYTYYVYRGRDRDDWLKETIKAPTLERARWKANAEWALTGYTVKNSSFKIVDNQAH
tara:strand:+ start:344 stop:520 length:177 start_codon:yes stop_codon:yes gene_type:complete